MSFSLLLFKTYFEGLADHKKYSLVDIIFNCMKNFKNVDKWL